MAESWDSVDKILITLRLETEMFINHKAKLLLALMTKSGLVFCIAM
jgi:hypothetical protein